MIIVNGHADHDMDDTQSSLSYSCTEPSTLASEASANTFSISSSWSHSDSLENIPSKTDCCPASKFSPWVRWTLTQLLAELNKEPPAPSPHCLVTKYAKSLFTRHISSVRVIRSERESTLDEPITCAQLRSSSQLKTWIQEEDPIHGGFKYTVLMSAFLILLAFSTILPMSVLLTRIEQDFGVSRFQVSSLMCAQLGVLGITTVFIGRIVSRTGIVPLAIAGYVTLIAGYVLSGLAPTFALLVVFYAPLAGFGAAALQLMGVLVGQDWFTPSGKAGTAIGFALSSIGLGNILFPLSLHASSSAYGWRAGMFASAVGTAGLAILSLPCLRERALHGAAVKRLVKSVLVVPKHHAPAEQQHDVEYEHPLEQQLQSNNNPPDGTSRNAENTHDCSSGVGGTAADRGEGSRKERSERTSDNAGVISRGVAAFWSVLGPRRMWRLRFTLMFTATVLGAFALYAPYVHLVPAAEHSGASDDDTSVMFILIGLVTLFSRAPLGIIADRTNSLVVQFIGNVSMLMSTILWIFFPHRSVFYVISAIFGFGSSAFIVGCSSVPKQMALPEDVANASALVLGLGFFAGATFSGMIMGAMYDYFKTYVPSLTALTILQVVPTLITGILAFHRPQDNAPPLPESHLVDWASIPRAMLSPRSDPSNRIMVEVGHPRLLPANATATSTTSTAPLAPMTKEFKPLWARVGSAHYHPHMGIGAIGALAETGISISDGALDEPKAPPASLLNLKVTSAAELFALPFEPHHPPPSSQSSPSPIVEIPPPSALSTLSATSAVSAKASPVPAEDLAPTSALPFVLLEAPSPVRERPLPEEVYQAHHDWTLPRLERVLVSHVSLRPLLPYAVNPEGDDEEATKLNAETEIAERAVPEATNSITASTSSATASSPKPAPILKATRPLQIFPDYISRERFIETLEVIGALDRVWSQSIQSPRRKMRPPIRILLPPPPPLSLLPPSLLPPSVSVSSSSSSS